MTKQLKLSLPDEQHARLKAAAERAHRSLHAEILWRLDQSEQEQGDQGGIIMTMTTQPETVKHLHGKRVHEHPGGDVPHDHPRKSRARRALAIVGAAAGLLVLALLLLSSHPSSAGTAAAPRPETVQQVAKSLVGTGVENSVTGQDTHQTIEAATPHGSFAPVAGGGRQFRCTLTLSSGVTMNAIVTLWGNGSVGWHQVGP